MRNARHREIESLLRERGECSVEEFARRAAVSTMTIRRDLDVLARAGKVIRTHGGATLGEKVLFEFNFLQRAGVNESAKQQIAETASALVQDGQSVIMDSGTTTLALARQLRGHRSLTVITSSLPIAATLQHTPGVKVLLLGGFMRQDAPDLVGALTEANLESLRADLAFVGADGIDLAGRVYNASVEVGRMLAKMAAAATATYVVADSSKIGRTALVRFGQLARWRGLVTNQGLSKSHAAALRKAGVKLILGNSAPPKP
jgi:DeoR family transcriptional regulator of aga operon